MTGTVDLDAAVAAREETHESGSAPRRHGLLEVGRNCRTIARADRFALLIDGSDYFSVLREALLAAERTIFIVGWDIDSRMRLVPGETGDGLPGPLGEFLQALSARRQRLRIYVLAWDFAMIYAFEREWMPVYQTGWRSQRGIVFRQDGTHPRGASHHQKMVVVDDRLAFVGGLDLTRSRWDTPAHAADEPRRRDANGVPYGPFHDVQAMFDGDAAAAIGALVRERWQRSCGKRIAVRAHRAVEREADPWPASAKVELRDVMLGISVTQPPYRLYDAVQDIQALTADAIGAARNNVYIENQYFTAAVVREALASRLARNDGPDIAVVVPRVQSGWLQEATMGVLRARLHRALVESDRYGRFRMYCPHVDGLGNGCVNVHSKLMIIDDTLITVGSANLNNRSMVLDTECNVTIDANGDGRIREAIAAWRNRLLAEHLDVPDAAVSSALSQKQRLNAAIETLQRREGRTLRPFTPVVTADLDALVPLNAWLDPERPIEPDALVREFIPESRHKSLTARFLLLGALVLAAATMAAVWQFTAVGHHLNLAELVQLIRRIDALPLAPVIVLTGYVVAAVISVPITVLIAATGLVFGAWPGIGYALGGTLLSALATYGLGVLLGRDAVRRLAGTRANRLSERLGAQGIVTVIVLRLLPIAPFTIVNLVAGASHIRLRDFMIGSTFGMVPGILLTVTFAHQLLNAIRHPGVGSVAAMLAIGMALVGISVMLQRWLGRRK
ncbi:VTT domain-containing protein [Trinickia diaoshuihuensis]|uniref:VTT domain-containing protein n=1 Tax=Trinickia diaoshuihuensis TaxID=2292265 RepID=UPI000E278A21|nr:VTT domain-containing protein [Trinickia diaoshuihuensis]